MFLGGAPRSFLLGALSTLSLLGGALPARPGLAQACPHGGLDPDTGKCRPKRAPGASVRFKTNVRASVVLLSRQPNVALPAGEASWRDAYDVCDVIRPEAPGPNGRAIGDTSETATFSLRAGSQYFCLYASQHMPALVRVDATGAGVVPKTVSLGRLPKVEFALRRGCSAELPADAKVVVRTRDAFVDRATGSVPGSIDVIPGVAYGFDLNAAGYVTESQSVEEIPPDGVPRRVEFCPDPSGRLSLRANGLLTGMRLELQHSSGARRSFKLVRALGKSDGAIHLAPGAYTASVVSDVNPNVRLVAGQGIGLEGDRVSPDGSGFSIADDPSNPAIVRLEIGSFDGFGIPEDKRKRPLFGLIAPARPLVSACMKEPECSKSGLNCSYQHQGAVCANAGLLSDEPLASQLLTRGCRLGDPRACAALSASAPSEQPRADDDDPWSRPFTLEEYKEALKGSCRAEPGWYWLSCLLYNNVDRRFRIYDASADPIEEVSFTLGVGTSVAIAPRGADVWTGLTGLNFVLLAPPSLGRVGLNAELGITSAALPVLGEDRSFTKYLAQVGFGASLGGSWAPTSWSRLDAGGTYSFAFNHSASSFGLKGGPCVLLGPHQFCAFGAYARVPDLAYRGGEVTTTPGGIWRPFVGGSYFFTVSDDADKYF